MTTAYALDQIQAAAFALNRYGSGLIRWQDLCRALGFVPSPAVMEAAYSCEGSIIERVKSCGASGRLHVTADQGDLL